MPITISDVAKSAGVSIKTVSRVVNNENNVSELTRQKVLATIEALGFTPNPLAQHLARGHSGSIGLLVYDVTASYVMEVLNGLLDVGERMGYRVTVNRCDITQADDVDLVIRMASQRQVDGIIFTPPCDNSMDIVGALQEMNFPFVQLTPHERSCERAWVAASDEQGAYEITSHLLKFGHRRIGFVQGNVDHQASWDRLAGFERALKAFGLEPDPELVCHGSWTFESGIKCACELLSLCFPPTAIVAANDEVAAGIIQAAWQLGTKCPDGLSVAGFDDVPLARQLCPPLTTVNQPIYSMATTAMSMLIEDLIQGDGNIRNFEVPTKLIIRQSTARLSEA